MATNSNLMKHPKLASDEQSPTKESEAGPIPELTRSVVRDTVREIFHLMAKLDFVPPEYLNRRQMRARAGISIRTQERMEREGRGPPLIRLSDKMIRCKTSDFDQWVESFREAGDDGGAQ